MVPLGLDSACLDESTVLALARAELRHDRRRLAEAHLDACCACRRLLGVALAGSEPTLSRDQLLRGASSLMPGAMVAYRYRIAGLLGRGGMGEVYRALDTLLGESVALKCVAAAASDDPRALKRLREEAQLARRVTHPHVCRVFDVGLLDDNARDGEPLLFVTMELLDGLTLGARIRAGGRLEGALTLQIARQLAAGLEAAHGAHVVHRDFKSDNVIVDRGRETRAVITDFGLARDLARGTSSAHVLAGTPAYVAPEQLEGEPSSVATDVYAYGVVLFEMSTGQLPFRAETALACMVKRLTEPAPKPRALVPELDARLEQVILGCLERQPERRPPSMSAVRAMLDQREVRRSMRRAPPVRTFGAPRLRIGVRLAALAAAFCASFALARSAARSLPPDVSDRFEPTGAAQSPTGATGKAAAPPADSAAGARDAGATAIRVRDEIVSEPPPPARVRRRHPTAASIDPEAATGLGSSADAAAGALIEGLVDPFPSGVSE